MIKDVYFTRIVTDEKQYGFGVVGDSGESVYIPGHLINEYELNADDEGTLNKMLLCRDRREKSDFIATLIIVEDSALQMANERLRDEIDRLCGLLDDAGVPH